MIIQFYIEVNFHEYLTTLENEKSLAGFIHPLLSFYFPTTSTRRICA